MKSPCRSCAVEGREKCWRTCEALDAYRAALDEADPAEARRVERHDMLRAGLLILRGGAFLNSAENIGVPVEEWS